MTEVFIGVVSHAASRFLASTGPDGLAHQLARRLNDATTEVAVRVNTENAWSAELLPITDDLVAESERAQRESERRWQAYLVDAGRRLRKSVALMLRQARRSSLEQRRASVRRLVNIELSHRSLLAAGLLSGADWILILEDDGGSVDPDECARGLQALLTVASARRQPAYINLSESFTPDELGIRHLLQPLPGIAWQGAPQRTVLSAQRPVTNTVCAIAYRAAFAREVDRRLAQAPLAPVLPIDWKLNEILMAMHAEGDLEAGDCWLVEPAPIAQLSMRPAAVAPDGRT